MRYRCPVCFFDRLPYPPAHYHICPCCGTEFGNDDAEFSHQQQRELWVACGANWFFGKAPEHWNPWIQLLKAGFWSPSSSPLPKMELRLRSEATSEPVVVQNYTPSFELTPAAA